MPATRPEPPSRPSLPARCPSALPEEADPPADAAKSDEEAIDDVHAAVASTGSLEAAARKLAQMAGISIGAAKTAVASVSPVANPSANPNAGTGTGGAQPGTVGGANGLAGRPVWMDDPEEQEYQAAYEGQDDEGMDEDEDDRLVVGPIEHLQEVVPGLWIGDLVAAMDEAGLKERGITNIVSLLRPSLAFSPDFAVYALEIDDSPTSDMLTHLPSLVAWIQEALAAAIPTAPPLQRSIDIAATLAPTRPGAVLVHCQAGMSRSATVVAAYLMRTEHLDPVQAVDRVRQARPVVDPSDTFWYQLGLYYNADGKVTLRDRPTRQFYMERTTSQIMNGDGGPPALDKMARYPATPSPSNPPTPNGTHGRRKIRCKMCRRHLAVREHMMDHILEQAEAAAPPTRPGSRRGSAVSVSLAAATSAAAAAVGASTSTTPSPLPAPLPAEEATKRGSSVSDILNPLTGLPGARSRHASMSHPDDGAAGGVAAVPLPRAGSQTQTQTQTPPRSPAARPDLAGLAAVSSSPAVLRPLTPRDAASTPPPPAAVSASAPAPAPARPILDADALASRLPPHLLALRQAGHTTSTLSSPIASSPPSSPEDSRPPRAGAMPLPVPQPSAAKQAGRKMSMLALTPNDRTVPGASAALRDRRLSASSAGSPGPALGHLGGPPILVNPKCSGYFVEPLTWMEPVLASGAVAGKLVCPNDKCGAKIGNFDWAGVQCGCREWVTPGFCIHRSKVDEVW
ncbi:tyrosine protein phosphatase yvh1 [Cryptotrichosporon argae]